MIPIDVMTVFFLASILLALTPGPDNIFVLVQSALHGKAAGFIVTLGLCTGLLFHTCAVALGVAAIFKTSAVAFNFLKVLGAIYLLYLAWQAFHASGKAIPGRDSISVAGRSLYLRGVIMNVTNPKVAIFFLAFLPQFTDPARGSLTLQIVLLGALFIASTLIVFGSIALGAGHIGDWLRKSARVQMVLNRAAGLVYFALAVKLATTIA